MEKPSQKDTDTLTRRDFCNKMIGRSSVATAAAALGYLAYKKPSVRSFFGVRNAYAANSGLTLYGKAD